MEQQDKIHLLLSMQEHPEQYTDALLQQMIADDPELAEQLELLALTKQAFVKREVENGPLPVDEEWQKFAAEHAEEFEASIKRKQNDACINFAEREKARPKGKKPMGLFPYKVAASIIGILFTAGVAFAAIHIVRMANHPKPQAMQTGQTVSATPTPALPADTIRTDTIAKTQPIVFDNVVLEKMLPQIAAYYHKEVVFQNADARQLRFYFVWKQEETLDAVLHRLNLFKSVTVEVKSDKIVVE